MVPAAGRANRPRWSPRGPPDPRGGLRAAAGAIPDQLRASCTPRARRPRARRWPAWSARRHRRGRGSATCCSMARRRCTRRYRARLGAVPAPRTSDGPGCGRGPGTERLQNGRRACYLRDGAATVLWTNDLRLRACRCVRRTTVTGPRSRRSGTGRRSDHPVGDPDGERSRCGDGGRAARGEARARRSRRPAAAPRSCAAWASVIGP